MTCKLYFPSSWGLSSSKLKETYDKLISADDDIVIVSNSEDCDYVVVQDSPDEVVDPNKRVIFFQREPDHVGRHHYSHPNIFAKQCHSDGDGWMPQTWWLSSTYDELSRLDYPEKNYKLSIVDSGRADLPGHTVRLKAISEVINKVSDLHMYGNITRGRENTGLFKTSLPFRAKEKAFVDYKYSFIMENGRTPNYFSEKIVDPMLCWTTPIYWGCSEISKYFPKGSYIEIKNLNTDLGDQVNSIISSGFHEDNLEALAEARDLILNKYNLIPTIKSLISKL
tara:strand:+ start:1266 stop:2108 length:843 start_codon:yes stop_codon:yes gene_type:complete